MATLDVTKLQFCPGRLAKSPTNFAAAFPHGGTALGAAAGIYAFPRVGELVVEAEEFGTIVESVYTGEAWFIGAALRTWDDDAISTVFTRTAEGSVSEQKLVEHHHTTYRAGQLGTARAVGIVFTPDDQRSNPAVYFKKAIPLVDETARFSFLLREELVFPVFFRAVPPDTGATVQFGLLEDFTV